MSRAEQTESPTEKKNKQRQKQLKEEKNVNILEQQQDKRCKKLILARKKNQLKTSAVFVPTVLKLKFYRQPVDELSD